MQDEQDLSDIVEIFKEAFENPIEREVTKPKNPFYDIPELLEQQDRLSGDIAAYIDSVKQPTELYTLLQVYIYNQQIINRVMYEQVRSMHHPKMF